MSYKSRFGITTIKKANKYGWHQLDISYDAEKLEDLFKRGNHAKRKPTLLFVPNIDKLDHSHIELTRAQAQRLYNWLRSYLVDTNPKARCSK